MVNHSLSQIYVVECRGKDKEQLLSEIARTLSFPSWFGMNLDALYDCLTDRQDPCIVQLTHWTESLLSEQDRTAFKQVFLDAAAEVSDNKLRVQFL